jgi:hypothetical protein
VNVANIARDSAVARPTVRPHFDVLVDTLIGTRLPPGNHTSRCAGRQDRTYWSDASFLDELRKEKRGGIWILPAALMILVHGDGPLAFGLTLNSLSASRIREEVSR